MLTVGIHFLDQLLQDLLVEGLTHETQDVGHHVAGDAAGFLVVKALEGLAEDYKHVTVIYRFHIVATGTVLV